MQEAYLLLRSCSVSRSPNEGGRGLFHPVLMVLGYLHQPDGGSWGSPPPPSWPRKGVPPPPPSAGWGTPPPVEVWSDKLKTVPSSTHRMRGGNDVRTCNKTKPTGEIIYHDHFIFSKSLLYILSRKVLKNNGNNQLVHTSFLCAIFRQLTQINTSCNLRVILN